VAQIKKVVVPDLGNFNDVAIIEINVGVGDSIKPEDTLITLESDKASMEIPSSEGGVVKALHVKVGDKVSQGDVILDIEPVASASDNPAPPAASSAPTAATSSQLQDVCVPDIGAAKDVIVIEVNVALGDDVDAEQTLITLESDKASMELPAPFAGKVQELLVKVGDKVSEGTLIARMASSQPAAAKPVASTENKSAIAEKSAAPAPTPSVAPVNNTAKSTQSGPIHASPSVRRLAREWGVDISQVHGTGRKARVMAQDVQQYVKAQLQKGGSTAQGGLSIPAMPAVDFSQWGEVETQELSRINKLSASYLHRNWVSIPHVTQFDEVDITEMEAFRKQQSAVAEKAGVKLTPLVFLMKVAVAALKQFPRFNASLAPDGATLYVKKYYHIGVAVDTPGGLVVPVIRDVDQKGLFILAKELAEISSKARAQKLTSADMQGSCFSISSLGGIGGTAFTPIINAPDVAILGVSKSQIKPVYSNEQFVPRLMLPLSLSYDHRVIDGALAARFITYYSSVLADIRRLLL